MIARLRLQCRNTYFGESLLRNPQLALKDVDFDSFLLLVLWRIAFLAHGFTVQFDAMSVVHEAIENAIGQRGVADLLVPLGHGKLGSEVGGTGLIAFFGADTMQLLPTPVGPNTKMFP
jgi:hypothetical protein